VDGDCAGADAWEVSGRCGGFEPLTPSPLPGERGRGRCELFKWRWIAAESRMLDELRDQEDKELRVPIRGGFADEAVEGLIRFAGEFDSEAGGRGDGGDAADAGGEGFLHDFKGGPAADH
jgi:hypothetical protein